MLAHATRRVAPVPSARHLDGSTRLRRPVHLSLWPTAFVYTTLHALLSAPPLHLPAARPRQHQQRTYVGPAVGLAFRRASALASDVHNIALRAYRPLAHRTHARRRSRRTITSAGIALCVAYPRAGVGDVNNHAILVLSARVAQHRAQAHSRSGRGAAREPLIKQMYSVRVSLPQDNPKGITRKWHLAAYFSQESFDTLDTVDSIAGLGTMPMPEGLFRSVRAGARGRRGDRNTEPTVGPDGFLPLSGPLTHFVHGLPPPAPPRWRTMAKTRPGTTRRRTRTTARCRHTASVMDTARTTASAAARAHRPGSRARPSRQMRTGLRRRRRAAVHALRRKHEPAHYTPGHHESRAITGPQEMNRLRRDPIDEELRRFNVIR